MSTPADPAWLLAALGELGVREYTPRHPGPNGEQSNPRVEEYQHEAGQRHTTDDVAWCASFVSWCLAQAGRRHLATGARAYAHYGNATDPVRGCIAAMYRGPKAGTKGHVTFFMVTGPATLSLTDNDGRLHTAHAGAGEFIGLGGNQNNQVTISAYDRERVLGWRQP